VIANRRGSQRVDERSPAPVLDRENAAMRRPFRAAACTPVNRIPEVNRKVARPFYRSMDERALICAWLRRYLAELEAVGAASRGADAERVGHECDAVRAVLWAVESGDYLTDLGGSSTVN